MDRRSRWFAQQRVAWVIMEIVGFFLAVVGFLLCGGVWIRSNKQMEAATLAQAELAAELDREKALAKNVQAKADVASAQVQRLEAELAEAVARRDEKAMAVAMWELELERSYRQWRDVIVPSNSARARGEVNSGQQLSFAVSQDVDRLREEVGVSIRYEGGLDLDLEPETALGCLRITEELLALAAKQADEVSVVLDQGDGPSILISLECRGWDEAENPESSELASTVERMATRLDGWVRWSRQDEDGITVSVQVPVPEA